MAARQARRGRPPARSAGGGAAGSTRTRGRRRRDRNRRGRPPACFGRRRRSRLDTDARPGARPAVAQPARRGRHPRARPVAAWLARPAAPRRRPPARSADGSAARSTPSPASSLSFGDGEDRGRGRDVVGKKAKHWASYVSECEREEEMSNFVHTDIRYTPYV